MTFWRGMELGTDLGTELELLEPQVCPREVLDFEVRRERRRTGAGCGGS